jgi:hypothetical protein
MKKVALTFVLTLSIILYNIGQLSGNESNVFSGLFYNTTSDQQDTIETGDKKDTTNIRFKDKNIRITENGEDTKIEVQEDSSDDWGDDEDEDWDDEDDWDFDFDFEEEDDFDVHWAGFEIGLNNYVNNDLSMSLSDQNDYMELNTGKSWNVNINFIEYDLNLIGDNLGIGTGLGLEFNDYRFDNQLPVKKGNGSILVDSSYVSEEYNLEKGKLTTTYITVPVILEYQVPVSNDNKLFFAAGIIGGLKLGSHSKVVYEKHGDKNKDKNRSDFYLSPFRYGYTARVGYGFLKLFANYYDTSLFQKDKGPELYPFSMGFMISF